MKKVMYTVAYYMWLCLEIVAEVDFLHALPIITIHIILSCFLSAAPNNAGALQLV